VSSSTAFVKLDGGHGNIFDTTRWRLWLSFLGHRDNFFCVGWALPMSFAGDLPASALGFSLAAAAAAAATSFQLQSNSIQNERDVSIYINSSTLRHT
jgi:hypothetical protein